MWSGRCTKETLLPISWAGRVIAWFTDSSNLTIPHTVCVWGFPACFCQNHLFTLKQGSSFKRINVEKCSLLSCFIVLNCVIHTHYLKLPCSKMSGRNISVCMYMEKSIINLYIFFYSAPVIFPRYFILQKK